MFYFFRVPKGSLLRETIEVMATLTGDSSLEDVRTLVIEDNILLKQTLETRGTIWRVIHARYFSGKDLSDIRTVACLVTSQLPEHHRHLILFYELAKSLPLVYDLTVDCLYKLYMEGRSSVDKADILAWLDHARADSHNEIGEWSPQTRNKVASNYLTIARDFGLLEGTQRKVFTRLYVPLPSFVYVLYRLKDEGRSTKAIVTSADFKLFLMDQRDVYLLLDEATRASYVTFQRAGDVYDLAFHYRNLTEVADELTRQIQ
jgi:hypothetical protein